MQVIVFGLLFLLADWAGSERVLIILSLDIERQLVLAVDKVMPPKTVRHRN